MGVGSQGFRIGCLEETAFRQGFISAEQLMVLASQMPEGYGRYLRELACGCEPCAGLPLRPSGESLALGR